MPKMPKWLTVLFRLCGGWWSAMSGVISIPLTFVGLFRHDSPLFAFAILGYFGLMVCAVRTIWTNLEVTFKHEDELGEKKAQYAKDMAQLHQELKVKEAEIQSLKTELEDTRLTVNGQMVIENGLRVLLHVNAVNHGRRPVRITRLAAVLTKTSSIRPMNPNFSPEQADAIAKLSEKTCTLHELVFFDKSGQQAIELSADGGAYDWSQEVKRNFEFQSEEHGGEKLGRGYIMLTSGKKFEFVFPLLTEWPQL